MAHLARYLGHKTAISGNGKEMGARAGPAYSGVRVAEGCLDAIDGGRERRNVVGEAGDGNHLAGNAVQRGAGDLGTRLRGSKKDENKMRTRAVRSVQGERRGAIGRANENCPRSNRMPVSPGYSVALECLRG